MSKPTDKSRRRFLKELVVGGAAVASAGLGSLPFSAVKSARAADSNPKSMIILGWDGAGLNNVIPMLGRGQLPNLQRLMDSRGGKMVPLQLIGRTNTLVSWSQVFTGLTCDQTSIVGNFYHDLDTNLVSGVYPKPYRPSFNPLLRTWMGLNVWYGQIPYEHSIFKPIKDLGYATGLFVSKEFLSRSEGNAFQAIAEQADSCVFITPLVDPTVKATETDLDDTYLRKLRQRALNFMNANEKFFVFLHLDPDVYGHKYGEASKRYRREFVRCDQALGLLLDTFSAETTNIIVMADHGFDPGSYQHFNAPDAWMVTDLAIDPIFVRKQGQKAFGTIRDVAHTILDYYHIPFESMPMQLRGVSLLA